MALGTRLRTIFINRDNAVRNGWKSFLFLLAFAVIPSLIFIGLAKVMDVSSMITMSGITILILLGITFAAFYLERKRIRDDWFAINGHAAKSAGLGSLIGIGIIAAAACAGFLMGFIKFSVNHSLTISAFSKGFVTILLAATVEELLFRGYLLKKLVLGTNELAAKLIVSALFAAAHAGAPNMNGVNGAIFYLNAFMLGYICAEAVLMTNSILSAIFVHVFWNFTQGLLGLSITGRQSGELMDGFLNATISESGKLVTGGNAIGLEGGLACLAMAVIAVVVMRKTNPLGWSRRREPSPRHGFWRW